MKFTSEVALGLLIPFFGTALGAGTVFFFKNGIGPRAEKLLMGLASGVMIAASVWSLMIPAIEMAEERGDIPWLPAAAGFLAGVGFLLLLDKIIPHLHVNSDEPEGRRSKLQKSAMLVLAVTLHNIPEGMAVGVVYAGAMAGGSSMTATGALALAVGMALQNMPEGAIVSAPLLSEGTSKKKAFLLGALSGIVEPVGAVVTILLTSLVLPVLPYILAFAAGAMIYVVVEELIPEAQTGDRSDICTVGVAFGFVMMMILDVALG